MVKMREVYMALFDRAPSVSGVVMPRTYSSAPHRNIFVDKQIIKWADGSPVEYTYRALRALCFPDFPIERAKYDKDLDRVIVENDRSPHERSYGIIVHDVQESRDCVGMTSYALTRNEWQGQVLLEYLLHFASYYIDTGSYLDMRSWTLCSGSRYDDGQLVGVHWVEGRLAVSRFAPTLKYEQLVARQVYLSPGSFPHTRSLAI